MRLFAALDVAKPIGETIAALVKEARATHASVKWVPHEQLHYTLFFFGDVSETKLPAIREGLAKIAQQHQPFDLEVFGTGAFGGGRSGSDGEQLRVIWLGARRGKEELEHLMEKCTDAFRAIREPEHQATAHLTLGRVFGSANKEQLLAFIRQRENDSFGAFRAERIALKESVLLPGGPRYRDLASFPLG